jgi:tRNA A37 threonylcarbamoyladenosine modification protein TsaB
VDARREEFFVGSFRKTVGARHGVPLQYEPADAGWVLKPDALRAYLEERAAHGASASCLVRAHDQAAVELRASLPASLTWQQIAGPLMDSIAAIALKEDLSGQPPSDAKLDAYYIRRPDAEINWIDD